jgi:hypothetical protein
MPTRFSAGRAFFAAIGRAFSELRLVAVLVGVNLFIGLLFAFPTLFPSMAALGHSSLAAHESFPSAIVFFQLGSIFSRGGAFFAGSAVLAIATSYAIQFFLSAGIAQRAWTEGPFRLSELLGASARLFGRNLRLFAWSLLGLLAVLVLIAGVTAGFYALDWPTVFTQKSEVWVFGHPLSFSAGIHLALVGLLFGFWRCSVDLGRVKVAAEDERKTRRAAWRSFKRMITSPLAWLGYSLLCAAGLLALLVMIRLHGSIAVTSTGKAWFALLITQVVVWVRLAFMVATYVYAAEIQRTTPPAPVPAPATEPTPVPAPAP